MINAVVPFASGPAVMTASSECSLGDKTSKIITFYKDLSHEVDGHFSRALSCSSTSSSSSTVLNCSNTNEANTSSNSLDKSNSPSTDSKTGMFHDYNYFKDICISVLSSV